MDNIIYILINEAMQGLCKIGHTKNSIERRLRELSVPPGVPLPFECFYAKKVKLSATEIERWLHDLFEKNRLNPRKEFFTTPPEKIVLALKYIEGEEVVLNQNVVADDKREIRALNKKRAIRDRFNFKMADIPIGAELVFSRDESIKAKVVDNRHIEFKREVMSLGKAANSILKYKYKHKVAGTLFWMYENETLDERRRRFESEE